MVLSRNRKNSVNSYKPYLSLHVYKIHFAKCSLLGLASTWYGMFLMRQLINRHVFALFVSTFQLLPNSTRTPLIGTRIPLLWIFTCRTIMSPVLVVISHTISWCSPRKKFPNTKLVHKADKQKGWKWIKKKQKKLMVICKPVSAEETVFSWEECHNDWF